MLPNTFRDGCNPRTVFMSSMPQLPTQDPNIVYETIDGETVLVNLRTGSYYSLVDVGTDIWTELQAGRTAQEILTPLYAAYNSPPAEIETAVRQLLASLVQEDLLPAETYNNFLATIVPASPNPPAPATAKREFRTPHLQKFTDMQELLLLDPVHDADEPGWPLSQNRAGF